MPPAFHKLSKLAAATVAQIRASAIWQVFDPASPKSTDDKTVTFAVLQEAIRDFAGPLTAAIRSVTSTGLTLTAADYALFVDSTAANRTVVLPAIATVPVGKIYIIRKTVAGNLVTIDPPASEQINGGNTVVLKGATDYVHIISNGTDWLLLNGTITP